MPDVVGTRRSQSAALRRMSVTSTNRRARRLREGRSADGEEGNGMKNIKGAAASHTADQCLFGALPVFTSYDLISSGLNILCENRRICPKVIPAFQVWWAKAAIRWVSRHLLLNGGD